MKKKTIILSYDYELFFGDRSGTVLKSIVEPTNKLMDVMEQNGFRGNFFVDYLMFRELEKFTDERAVSDLKLLKDQIRDMVRRGHRVELHLHPHWMDAKYNGDGTWNFADFTHYSLSSLDEDTIVEMFKEGTDYLNKLAGEAEPGYKIVAFRAGGWAVQPFDKLKKGFIETGISIDSSSAYGVHSGIKNQTFDFRNMPHKEVYRFENDVCKEDKNGAFLEVPITTMPFSKKTWLYLKFHKSLNREGYLKRHTDGTHIRSDNDSREMGLLEKIIKKLKNRQMMQLSQHLPYSIMSFIDKTKLEYYCIIDHPKDFSDATIDGIKELEGRCISVNYVDLIKQ